MNLEIVYVRTCLADYWSGHHKAHVCVPVWNGMTFNELKSSLHSEISEGAICGSDTVSDLLRVSGDFSEEEIEIADQAAHNAVDNIVLSESADQYHLFGDIDEADETQENDYHDTVYAYFLIVETEN